MSSNQTLTWIGTSGTGSGSWFDSSNLNSSVVPTSGDTAIVNSGVPVVSGGTVSGVDIVFGASSGGSVEIDAVSATFKPVTSGFTKAGQPAIVDNLILTVTGGGFSTPLDASLVTSGLTTFEGVIAVEPIAGTFTIDAEPAGSAGGEFMFLNSTGATFVFVTQEAALHLKGERITNSAVIEVEGAAVVAGGTVFAGPGIVELDNGGALVVSGHIVSGAQIDFADGTGRVTVASGGTVSGAVFGFTGVSGGRIDLQGIAATSETVSGGVLTLFSGGTAVASLNVQTVSEQSLNPSVPPPTAEDFTLTPDNSGGTFISYTPPGPTDLSATLPTPVVAPTGTLVSLNSILAQSFGPNPPAWFSITLIPPRNAPNNPANNAYWSSPVAPAWYVNGKRISEDTVVNPGDNVQLLVGNNITNAAQFTAQVTPTVTSDSGEYVTYSVFTVDPSVAALAHTSGWVAGHPTSGNIKEAAEAIVTVFPDVNNTEDCPWVA